MDDSTHTRQRLTEEWTALIERGVAAGVPDIALVETMLDVALSHYRGIFGDEMAGNYFRELMLSLDMPITEREVAEQLIVGEDPRPNSVL